MKRKVVLLITILAILIFLVGTQIYRNKETFLFNNDIKLNENEIKPLEEKVGDVVISFDPRLELLASVEMNSKFYNIVKYDTEYKGDMEKYFNRVRKHDAVKTFKKLSENGLYCDIPPFFMLNLTEVPNLEVVNKIDDNIISNFTKDTTTTNRFIDELRDYAKKANVQKFFIDHKDFYKEKIKDAKEIMQKRNYVEDIEDYYGMKQRSYNVILSPLFEGNYGTRILREDGLYDLYAIIGGSNFTGKINEEVLRYLIWHEFSHSFINPITEKYESDLKSYENNFSMIKDDMKKQGYSSWITTINEHIIRAVTVRLNERTYGTKVAQELLKEEREKGFIFIDALCDKLKYYENNREKYSNIEKFYPELIKVFQKNESEYKYTYIKPLKLQYNENTLLKTIIEEKWDRDAAEKIIGKSDSYFNRYDIYFNKGIAISHSEIIDEEKIISITGKISNVVYNKKYNGNISDGINMSCSKNDVLNLLGKPHFEDIENEVFGYKTEKFYIFFVGENEFDEISIYRRNTDYNRDTIRKIVEKYKKQDNEMKLVFDVTKDIDAEWSIYDYKYDGGYKYSNRSQNIARGFLSQGVKLHYHYSGEKKPFVSFITIGGNYEGNLTEDISFPDKVEGLKVFNSDIIKLELDKDYIFESEIQRLNHKKALNDRIKRQGVLSPDKTMIALRNDDDGVDPFLSGGYLIYLNKNKPDVEFKAVFYNPDHFIWLSDRYIAYDVFKKGIYIYDIDKNKSFCIYPDFTSYLESAEEGVIRFKSLNRQTLRDEMSTMKYEFDKEGNITVEKIKWEGIED